MQIRTYKLQFFTCLCLLTGVYSLLAEPLFEGTLESENTDAGYVVEIYHRPDAMNSSGSLHVLIEADPSNEVDWQSLLQQAEGHPTTLVRVSFENLGERQRIRDLSGDAKQGIPGSGGAIHFYQFIRKELIPFVENQTEIPYVHVTLHGRGIPGNWIFWVLMHHGDAFDALVAESPIMTWHASYPFRAEYEYYATGTSELPARIWFLTLPDDSEENTRLPVRQFNQLLTYRRYQTLDFKWLDGSQHGSGNRESLLRSWFETLSDLTGR